jgi:3-isopropylmalate/(R)-2-methylmalate dehydratase large subunit
MSVEAGATSGIVPPDSETLDYLKTVAGVKDDIEIYKPDEDAKYEQVIHVDVSSLGPQIACPHSVDNIKPVEEVQGKKIHQIVIGSCTNGRLDDLEAAAGILRGRKVARGTRMLIFPASWRIYLEGLRKGYLADLAEAGAVICNPGCGPCLGVHQGALADQETALATTNRNFRGRMGNPNAEVYLCSPEVAAASAIAGVISDPRAGGR